MVIYNQKTKKTVRAKGAKGAKEPVQTGKNKPKAGKVPAEKKEQQFNQQFNEEFDPYQIIQFPLSTEKSIRQIEFDNKLVFVVHARATKTDVKKAVETLFKVKVAKVNIHNSFKGQKRAYVRLSAESLASDVSADLGLI